MKLYNTMSKQKEEFVPLEEGKVRMYVCGPTVYNFIHIGNARPMIVFDTVRRYFEYKGYDVNYVSNFTDVDDKIINKAIEEGTSADEVSKRFIAECKKDMAGMNVKPATKHPLATEEICGMVDMIQTLIDKGYAYEKNGTVYIATEDGSVGTKGNVINAIEENHLQADVIFACGPMPMLRAIKKYAEEKKIKAYISLEEHMACGVGACLGCVVKTKEVDHHSHVHNARICTDGPVFDAEEVEI